MDIELKMLTEEEMKARRRKKEKKLTGRALNTKILDTKGDMNKLKELAKQYGYSAKAPYAWKNKFRPYFTVVNRR